MIEITVENGVAEIVLDAPQRMNALDEAALAELQAAYERAAAGVESGEVRAVLLRGEGRGFCAGRDISAVVPAEDDATAYLRDRVTPVLRAMSEIPVPTFAAVQGACLGVGLGLAIATDVVYVAEDAKIGSPFANLGATLDSGGHALFTERLGAHRTLDLIYTAELMSGAEAVGSGLFSRAVPRDEVGDLRGVLVDGDREVDGGRLPSLGSVRDAHDLPIADVPHDAREITQSGSAQRDLFDRADDLSGVDEVADAVLVLDDHEHAREEVLDKALRSESESNSADAGRREYRGHIEAEFLTDHEYGDAPDDDRRDAAQNRTERLHALSLPFVVDKARPGEQLGGPAGAAAHHRQLHRRHRFHDLDRAGVRHRLLTCDERPDQDVDAAVQQPTRDRRDRDDEQDVQRGVEEPIPRLLPTQGAQLVQVAQGSKGVGGSRRGRAHAAHCVSADWSRPGRAGGIW